MRPRPPPLGPWPFCIPMALRPVIFSSLHNFPTSGDNFAPIHFTKSSRRSRAEFQFLQVKAQAESPTSSRPSPSFCPPAPHPAPSFEHTSTVVKQPADPAGLTPQPLLQGPVVCNPKTENPGKQHLTLQAHTRIAPDASISEGNELRGHRAEQRGCYPPPTPPRCSPVALSPR